MNLLHGLKLNGFLLTTYYYHKNHTKGIFLTRLPTHNERKPDGKYTIGVARLPSNKKYPRVHDLCADGMSGNLKY